MIAQGLPALGGALAGALSRTGVRRLVPTGTTSNSGWTPSSGTAHAALAADDALYLRASTSGAAATFTLG